MREIRRAERAQAPGNPRGPSGHVGCSLPSDMRHAPVTFGRLAVIVAAAFLFGGASAEVAVRTHRAVERVRTEREIGASGQLVALQITGLNGEVLARPRLIAPHGKAAELVLHDPGLDGAVRLTFRVEADREPTGEIELAYELTIPGQALSASGKVSLTPGVEQSMHLGDGVLVATWLAMPVPSAQFDAYLESEAALRRSGTKTS